MPTVEYLPVATGGGANVVDQAAFAGSAWQADGFVNGLADPAEANKIWRQSSMIAAALAHFISNVTGLDILDDGNLAALITNLTNAVTSSASGGVLTQATLPYGDNSTKVANSAFVQAAIAPLNTHLTTIDGEITTIDGAISSLGANYTALAAAVAALAVTGTLSAPGRAANTTYTNTSGGVLIVSGSINTTGSATGNINCVVNGQTVWSNDVTATLAGGRGGFFMAVPNGATYRVNISGAATGVVDWAEVLLDV